MADRYERLSGLHKKRAYTEGTWAGRKDEGRATCPYLIDGPERTAWLDDYTAGSIAANEEAHAQHRAGRREAKT